MSSSRLPHQRLIAPGLGVLLVLLVAAGCGSSASSSGPKTTTKANIGQPATADRTTSSDGSGTNGDTKGGTGDSAPATTPAETTETAPPTTTGPTGLDNPKDAAKRLYDAWKAGDKVTAATVATPEAVQGIFATAPGDYAPYNSCDSGEFDTSGCLYRGNSGTIQFTMERRGPLWVVIEALFAAP